MGSIFAGMLLVLFDFTINIGNCAIELLPDFLGYYLMLCGLNKLPEDIEYFSKVKPVMTAGGIYSAVVYGLDVFGIFRSEGFLGWVGVLLGIISVLLCLYVTYCVVQGVLELEKTRGWNLEGYNLKNRWMAVAICEVCSYCISFIPVLGLVVIIASWVFVILFLAGFSNTKNIYENLASLHG